MAQHEIVNKLLSTRKIRDERCKLRDALRKAVVLCYLYSALCSLYSSPLLPKYENPRTQFFPKARFGHLRSEAQNLKKDRYSPHQKRTGTQDWHRHH